MAEVSQGIGVGNVRSPDPVEVWNSGARFYFIMSLITALIIVLGFTPSFYLKPVIKAPTPPLTLLTITHGVVFTAWLVLMVVQSGLIATGKRAPHRQLGMLGAILFGAMISLGLSTAITAARLGHAPPGAPPALAFMALPVIALMATTVLVAIALLNRRRSDWHKRLMLAGFFAMTGPGVHRLAIGAGAIDQAINLVFIVNYVLLGIAIGHDWMATRRVHPANQLAVAIFVITHAAVMWSFGSPAWLFVAQQLTA